MMGNDNITAYQYLSMYSFNSSASYAFGTDPSYVQGVYETRTANPLVTWEKAKTWNVGFSAQFLSGKLGLDFDYFQSRRNDILITRNASVPTYSGLSLPAENLGKVKNHGFEVVATYRDKAGDLNGEQQVILLMPIMKWFIWTKLQRLPNGSVQRDIPLMVSQYIRL